MTLPVGPTPTPSLPLPHEHTQAPGAMSPNGYFPESGSRNPNFAYPSPGAISDTTVVVTPNKPQSPFPSKSESPTPVNGQQDTKKDKWGGTERRKLSQEGYRTLAILATFLAAVQAPLLAASLVRGYSTSDQVVTMLFIWGLFADLFGAVLNYGSTRWFEMLTTEETEYLQKVWVASESKDALDELKQKKNPSIFDIWLAFSIKLGYYLAVLGLVLLVAGLLVLIWSDSRLRLVFKIISTLLCVFFSAFSIPFAHRHDRKNTIYLLRLKRQSG